MIRLNKMFETVDKDCNSIETNHKLIFRELNRIVKNKESEIKSIEDAKNRISKDTRRIGSVLEAHKNESLENLPTTFNSFRAVVRSYIRENIYPLVTRFSAGHIKDPNLKKIASTGQLIINKLNDMMKFLENPNIQNKNHLMIQLRTYWAELTPLIKQLFANFNHEEEKDVEEIRELRRMASGE